MADELTAAIKLLEPGKLPVLNEEFLAYLRVVEQHDDGSAQVVGASRYRSPTTMPRAIVKLTRYRLHIERILSAPDSYKHWLGLDQFNP